MPARALSSLVGGVHDGRCVDPAAVGLDRYHAPVVADDRLDRSVRHDPDARPGELLEMRPDHGVVVDDRVVVEDGARDRLAAAQDRQVPERVVG